MTFMEKGITVVARYYYQHGYFVEASQENSATVRDRDYWLCRKNSAKKLYMFSSPYRNDQEEEHLILNRISENIQKFENPSPNIRYA